MNVRKGGVLINVKCNIPNQVTHVDRNLEILLVNISTSFPKTLLGMCYIAPDADSSFANELTNMFSSIRDKFNNHSTLLLGDLNFPNTDWYTLTAHSPELTQVLEFCSDFNLEQMLYQPHAFIIFSTSP